MHIELGYTYKLIRLCTSCNSNQVDMHGVERHGKLKFDWECYL